LYAVEYKFVDQFMDETLTQPVEDSEEVNTKQINGAPPCHTKKKRSLRESLKLSVRGNTAKATLVIVNPKSGVQRAQQIFEESVRPMLQTTGCSYDYLVTTRANHARSFVSNYPDLIQDFEKIVIVSGDGLIHEVYQGLATRPDANQAFKIPLAMIPGGSGNALARSVLHYTENPDEVMPEKREAYMERCTDIALRGQASPMDLARVVTCTGQEFTSFMSFGLGLLSDIDIDSEVLRVLGEFRFAVYGILKGLQLKSYRVRISYVRAATAGSDVTNDSDDVIVDEDDFVLVQCVTKPWMAESLLIAPHFRSLSDGHISLILIRKGVSRKNMFSWFLYQDKGYHVEMPCVDIVPVTWVKIEPATKSGNMTIDGEVVDFGPIEARIMPSAGSVMTSNAS